jgi:biotin carboxylase
VLADAVRVAANAVRALGLRDGIAFPQVIASARGTYVVEVAARIAAGQMADLVRHGTGIDVFEIATCQALGRDVDDALVAPRFHRPVAIRFLTASPGFLPVGRVTSIRGLDAVRASAGVLDAGLYFGVGDDIRPVQVDADRRGYVVATGASSTEALERAETAARKLWVEVAPTHPHDGALRVRTAPMEQPSPPGDRSTA